MIVLDTNVISAVMRDDPDPDVVAWLDAQPPESIWITSVNVYEARFGISAMPPGRRREQLRELFRQFVATEMAGRVLDLDLAAAIEAADLWAKLRSLGRPVDYRDVMIAGIVSARRATLATRNTRHFIDAGVPLVNPWEHVSG